MSTQPTLLPAKPAKTPGIPTSQVLEALIRHYRKPGETRSGEILITEAQAPGSSLRRCDLIRVGMWASRGTGIDGHEIKTSRPDWLRELDAAAAAVSRSMWCFLPIRQFAEPPYRGQEFRAAGWRLSQDIEAEHLVWEKHNGSSLHADRFKRVHEIACHWYRGAWRDVYHQVPTTADATARTVRHKQRPPHTGHIEAGSYTSHDGGPRLMRSVIRVRSMHGRAIHRTQKPLGLLQPLIEYACPPGGLVADLFAGSCSTLVAARMTGRRAVGVELRECDAEKAARWLAQPDLFGGEAA